MKLGAVSNGSMTSLRTRVLMLTLIVFAAASIAAYIAFSWMVDTTIIKLGTLFAEKQVLFDRYRGMESLSREASLAATLTRSQAIREWAVDEENPEKMAVALNELERFRLAFADRSYFFINDKSGNYYFNDRENSYGGSELRYTLDRQNPRDGWYYKTVAASQDCQLNVDRDDILKVTKVWINCPVVDGETVLGVIGTGLDLSRFISEVVDITQPGVDNMFVDHSGAIQAHRDPNMVDFHSLTNDIKSKKTIFGLLDNQSDRDELAEMMETASESDSPVEARFITIDGQKFLAGVGYLDNLGWFNVSLMDIDTIIDRRLFTPAAALLGLILIVAALLITLLFKRIVLDRLARLESSVRSVEHGNYSVAPADGGNDEIGRLSRSFGSMAATVGNNTEVLETLVRKRTAELEQLADVDPLTGAYNRRGLMRIFERNALDSQESDRGLLLIDLDFLKNINDTYGHRAGDIVLADASRRLRRELRDDDICARWGGDEFAVLIGRCDENSLADVASRMLAVIGGEPFNLRTDAGHHVTISIGACLTKRESIDMAAARADAALYSAKDAGRNQFVIYEKMRVEDIPHIARV